MAYSEIVSFIREQMKEGRDVRTIREHLIRQNVDSKIVDSAFDEVFGVNEPYVNASHGVHKFVISGLFMLILIFIGVGVGLYMQIPSPFTGTSNTENPNSEITGTPMIVPEETLEEPKICDFRDTELKYECFISKFKRNEIQCHEIDDYDEREFCYVAQDLYVLNA
ncbi:hypothetical protein ACFLTH_14255 [Bacteroidota bacterium]